MLLELARWMQEFARFFALFNYITMRAILSALTALALTLWLGPMVIERLARLKGGGQPIRSDGPATHFVKAGTPTMGGALILLTITLATLLWGDLRNPQDVTAAVQDIQVVLHLGFVIPKLSVTGVNSEEQPDFAYAVNVGGTRNLLEALKSQPVPPRLIFASSLHVYGPTQDLQPPRTVSDAVHPIEHYAQHKVICEEMIKESGSI